MPGGEAIANAEERAASIIAEAEARARQMEEAVSRASRPRPSPRLQLVRDEADRFHTEAEQAKADANLAVGQLAEARASYQGAKVEVEDLRAQLAHARTEIDDVRNAMPLLRSRLSAAASGHGRGCRRWHCGEPSGGLRWLSTKPPGTRSRAVGDRRLDTCRRTRCCL